MTATPLTHVVVDDDSLRTALERLLSAAAFRVNSYASAGDFLLDPPRDEPGCLLLDLRLPGPSGPDLQQALVRHGIRLPVIVLTGPADLATGVRATKAGAGDFLTRPVRREPLLAAIAAALQADAARRSAHGDDALLRERFAQLTPRERSVVELVVAGRLDKQIADVLGIAERTVKAQRAQAMAKPGAADPASPGRMAAQLQGRGGRRRASRSNGRSSRRCPKGQIHVPVGTMRRGRDSHTIGG